MTVAENTQKLDVIHCSNMDDFKNKISSIYDALEKDGFVILQSWDISKDVFMEIATFFGQIQGHPNADQSGAVQVKPDHARQGNTYERYVSKTTSEVSPHTDGSYLDGCAVVDGKIVRINPPSFVIFQCTQPAEKGGVNFVIDAQEIFQEILVKEPEHAKVLSQPRTVSICANRHFSTHCPIFEKISEEKWRLRFRSDLMYIDPAAYSSVKYLVDNYFLNPKFRKHHLLTKGQIIVLDNFRVLHGRDEIISNRVDGVRLLNKTWIFNNEIEPLSPFKDSLPDSKTFDAYNVHIPLDIKSKKLRDLKTGIYLKNTYLD